MNKYLALFRTALVNSFQYRARAAVWFIYDITPAIVMLLFWQAALHGRTQIVGYNAFSISNYYLLVMIVRVLVFTYPDITINEHINSGKIGGDFSRPYHYLAMRWVNEVAYKPFRLLLLILPVFFWIRFGLSSAGEVRGPENLGLFIIACTAALWLIFYFKSIFGLLTFWFTDIAWLIDLEWLAMTFLGGTLFPLDLLPVSARTINSVLPFQYMIYFPIQILMNRLSLFAIIQGLLFQLAWIAVMYALAKLLLNRGRRRYSYFGG